jgi:hypothetical protein
VLSYLKTSVTSLTGVNAANRADLSAGLVALAMAGVARGPLRSRYCIWGAA